MRNFLAVVLCGAMLLSSSLCFATVDDSKIALGSIYPGMIANDLVNAVGQPNYRDGDDWMYQNFKVEVERGVVEKVSTYSDALMTGGGVRVGLSAQALNSTYGSADKIDHDSDGVEYEYYSNTRKIEFKVVNDIITKITCELRD